MFRKKKEETPEERQKRYDLVDEAGICSIGEHKDIDSKDISDEKKAEYHSLIDEEIDAKVKVSKVVLFCFGIVSIVYAMISPITYMIGQYLINRSLDHIEYGTPLIQIALFNVAAPLALGIYLIRLSYKRIKKYKVNSADAITLFLVCSMFLIGKAYALDSPTERVNNDLGVIQCLEDHYPGALDKLTNENRTVPLTEGGTSWIVVDGRSIQLFSEAGEKPCQ